MRQARSALLLMVMKSAAPQPAVARISAGLETALATPEV